MLLDRKEQRANWFLTGRNSGPVTQEVKPEEEAGWDPPAGRSGASGRLQQAARDLLDREQGTGRRCARTDWSWIARAGSSFSVGRKPEPRVLNHRN
ncbi:hypothetical protein MA16_Dca006952 [Dendrobium catenatum]|uniref:Uncharacterized protein n=1 Tax=Dendrobium catenatum TaxID=906689 RepID=A0A2I0VWZ1_9ASPA|nr:hypothetical protein MA16_Dca006952 [Dendrobium catenatum]